MSTFDNAYNIILKPNDLILAGQTDVDFSIEHPTEEVLEKENDGVPTKEKTGVVSRTFSVSGLQKVKEAGEDATHVDRHDIIDMVEGSSTVPFIYGDKSTGGIIYTGNLHVVSYSESSGSSGRGTYTINCEVSGTVTQSTTT